jgi:hypothetical protein
MEKCHQKQVHWLQGEKDQSTGIGPETGMAELESLEIKHVQLVCEDAVLKEK